MSVAWSGTIPVEELMSVSVIKEPSLSRSPMARDLYSDIPWSFADLLHFLYICSHEFKSAHLLISVVSAAVGLAKFALV
jgi:hypothetical protein